MRFQITSIVSAALLLTACGGGSSSSTTIVDNNNSGSNTGSSQSITLNFAPKSFGENIDCSSVITGFGLDGQDTVQMQDLRFYVSDVVVTSSTGQSESLALVSNEFQYADETGSVSLIDFTDVVTGYCAQSSSGTARTNAQITGTTTLSDVAQVDFSIGVPQAMMKEITASYTTEDAPTPLNEMFWSWASGYRHFVFNFGVLNAASEEGSGAVHIGSRNCVDAAATELADKESCEFVNNPQISLSNFNPSTDVITVNLDALFNGVSFVQEVSSESDHMSMDMSSDEMSMTGTTRPGVSCHSAPAESQPDCAPIFNNFGLSLSDGTANAANNSVFQFETAY
ncbi:MAG: MbnP family copper-binding protein [Pseudomonadota bacterium]|nr:MbnP family copper-binding protein [Pseudomonadota bacterium]